ncbi:uncharacterized protein LOC111283991 isoform X2 [Durio zibethinus]|uniref:Uncharacterized protein LOC111283991 isoform X2 n=1 Tax=Durio zibethinus TaxID=66656 RepID=A0A6P5XKN4_DURZI|nr:uncharacterized protein LOC111283991 isoform X2 [Durio zibethinus]
MRSCYLRFFHVISFLSIWPCNPSMVVTCRFLLELRFIMQWLGSRCWTYVTWMVPIKYSSLKFEGNQGLASQVLLVACMSTVLGTGIEEHYQRRKFWTTLKLAAPVP